MIVSAGRIEFILFYHWKIWHTNKVFNCLYVQTVVCKFTKM